MATAPLQAVVAIYDAATKMPLILTKANATFKIADDLVVGDLYRSADMSKSIVIVHKKVAIEDLDAMITMPKPPAP